MSDMRFAVARNLSVGSAAAAFGPVDISEKAPPPALRRVATETSSLHGRHDHQQHHRRRRSSRDSEAEMVISAEEYQALPASIRYVHSCKPVLLSRRHVQ